MLRNVKYLYDNYYRTVSIETSVVYLSANACFKQVFEATCIANSINKVLLAEIQSPLNDTMQHLLIEVLPKLGNFICAKLALL